MQVLECIAPGPDEIVLPKTSSNVFASTNIDYILRSLGVKCAHSQLLQIEILQIQVQFRLVKFHQMVDRASCREVSQGRKQCHGLAKNGITSARTLQSGIIFCCCEEERKSKSDKIIEYEVCGVASC